MSFSMRDIHFPTDNFGGGGYYIWAQISERGGYLNQDQILGRPVGLVFFTTPSCRFWLVPCPKIFIFFNSPLTG